MTKPPGSLGRLEQAANRLFAIGDGQVRFGRRRVYVVAGDHGVTAEGVSVYPRDVTPQMVANFLGGGAAINVIARQCGIEVVVVDAGVDAELEPHPELLARKVVRGTANFAVGPAMSRDEAEECLAIGIALAADAAREGIAMIGLGEMGIGNTTSASAIAAVLTDSAPEAVVGRGTGADDAMLQHKIDVVRRAIDINAPDADDPVGVLSKVGGAEIGVLAGLAIGCAAERIPVVADGFISTAAAAIAVVLSPDVRDVLFVGHLSQEPGHRALVDCVGRRPLLDLGMRLGEGTGAALAMHLLDTAGRLLNEMATFDSAGVSDRS